MKKYRGKIIAAAVVAAVLVFVYWWGGNSPALHGWKVAENQAESTIKDDKPQENKKEQKSEDNKNAEVPADTAPEQQEPQPAAVAPGSTATPENRPQNPDNTPMTAEEKIELAEKIAESSAGGTVSAPAHQETSVIYPEQNSIEVSGEEDNAPAPMTPQESKAEVQNEGEHTCTLSVRCDSILSNMAWLDPAKVELVPSDGVIFAEKTVTFYEGESVFNLLSREMKKNKIHMEFENTPLYNSAYIEGIANLYEFDCGELSGWMYKVNGWFPNYGCSRYKLKDGDKVEWVYTCNLGVDVGGYYSSSGGQKSE